MEQAEAFPLSLTAPPFTLQGNGHGSSARIEAHTDLHPAALDYALREGLLRGEWDGPRLRYRRHFSNPLRAYQAALHIHRVDHEIRPSFFPPPETTIGIERLFADLPVLGWTRARKIMLKAMPFCAIADCSIAWQPLLEVHHIHGRGGSNPHRLTNLITLCCNHHAEATRGYLPFNLERLWVAVVDETTFPLEYR